jgi:hypothetical protein
MPMHPKKIMPGKDLFLQEQPSRGLSDILTVKRRTAAMNRP